MKIIRNFIIVFILILYTSINYGQNLLLEKKITISIIDKSLIEAINMVSEASSINFSYNADLIPKKVLVRCKFESEKVSDVLTLLLKRYNIGYKEVRNQIILYKLPQSDKNFQEIKKLETLVENIKLPVELEKYGTDKVYADTLLLIYKDTLKVVVYDTVQEYFTDTAII